ncbi:MAG: hypothetical protein GY745_00635 [Actinomycetia bacterium]|nr:hypothetical protein [Actinomycetes bacterium]
MVSEAKVIKGVDGNDVTLFVHRPVNAKGPLPGILHLHGGGMTILEAAGPGYDPWRTELAAAGLVVVGSSSATPPATTDPIRSRPV